MKKNTFRFLVALIVLLPVCAHASTALQTVETYVNQLIAVLSDQTMSGPAGEEKKKASIRSISDNLFDFPELSRFALGAGWKSFTTEQQESFVVLYRELLESIYMGRLLQYKDEKVVFKKEVALSDTRSEVQSDVQTGGGNIPIDYRLFVRDGVWKVYDIVIENASLAKNYRAQFSSILAKDPPDKLLDILREKVRDQKAEAK